MSCQKALDFVDFRENITRSACLTRARAWFLAILATESLLGAGYVLARALLCVTIPVNLVTLLDLLVVVVYYLRQELFKHGDSNYLQHVNVLFISSTGDVEFQRSVPDTLTTWVASAFAVSNSTGFGVVEVNSQVGLGSRHRYYFVLSIALFWFYFSSHFLQISRVIIL